MPAAVTDKFRKATSGTRPEAAYLTATKTIGASSITVNTTTGWATDTGYDFIIYRKDTSGNVVAGTVTTWVGTVSGTTISSLTLKAGTDQEYASGELSVVVPTVTAAWNNALVEGLLESHNQDGSLKQAAVLEALGISGLPPADYTAIPTNPSTVTYNGNRSYSLVFNGVDYTDRVNPGTRLRTTRTVAAPTRCTSLNGTTQYYSKSSPAGMTFTDDFVVGAWIKLTAYSGSSQIIASRWNGTSGWMMEVNSSGQIVLQGTNGASANFSAVTSYQSVPVNKWVHIAAQLDMSAFTATTTTSYIMIDGADVPVAVSRGGTNPTALVQAGDLEIGSRNGGGFFFGGKVAQAFVSSAKITQANIRTLISQGLTSSLISSHSIISAYSFDNSINDLNTTNANNLTANGSAVATNADSPFGTQASGSISSTLDYAIVQSAAFSTNTTVVVQVPEGCAIPTSGGISAISYSSAKAPYGMPIDRGRWIVNHISRTTSAQNTPTANQWYNVGSVRVTAPVGSWIVINEPSFGAYKAASTSIEAYHVLSTSSSSEANAIAKSWRVTESASSTLSNYGTSSRSEILTLAAATDYYGILLTSTTSATQLVLGGSNAQSVVSLENAYV